MHELAASQGLVNLVIQEAEKLSAVRVLQVNVALGKLSCLMPEIVQDYYNLFAEDTIAQDAKLSVRRLDGAEFYLDSIEIEEPDP
ncbi:MAG: hydrogenase maturation nickel metallochaperone HypA [Eubacterium sp.]|nr:hydrogenase maturation nickel metallochaperone HypA [Eubacterium sp.]MBQ6363893.1 hydrogenase maturation nickel metallochaperone HypA [Lachnospiraceae bacterium]